MKSFVIKVIVFIFPFSLLLTEMFLPINTFTYRPWESLLYLEKSGIAYPFYPNQNLEMYSVGDLCYYTKNEIKKYENWKTDELGFRNDKFINNPEILLIGDSFIAGSSLPQDATLTNVLKKKLSNEKIYSLAPSNFNEFIQLLNNHVIAKPKLVVFSTVERGIPPSIMKNSIDSYKSNNSNFQITLDQIKRLYIMKYLGSRMLGLAGTGIESSYDRKMFFLNGVNQVYYYDKIGEIAETIIQYKKFCDSINVDFIFLPLPNKETVYYELVPMKKQPDYIEKLNTILSKNGIITVNTLGLFNNKKTNSSHYLYHLDDSHWNPLGVNLVADELIKAVRTQNKGYMQ